MNTRLRRARFLLPALAAAVAACNKSHRPEPDDQPEAPAPPTAPAQPSPPAAPTSEPAASPAPQGLAEVFPGVRLDLAARVVEFDGVVPIEAHDPDAPHVFLEVIACTPDTKEHESLVMTRAKAQHVHAALLLLGLQPGTTGSWAVSGEKHDLVPVDPTGPEISVDLVVRDSTGQKTTSDARAWVLDIKSGRHLGDEAGPTARVAPTTWLFAGSRFVTMEGHEVYDADGVGTLIGLCTFGSETVAWGRTVSPDSQVQEPEWIADPAAVPPSGTAVTVRLRARPAR